MQTRISRRGKPQVLIGVWIDKPVFAELEHAAKRLDLTVADVTRDLLSRAVEMEKRRPDVQRLLNGLLSLNEAELKALRDKVVRVK